MRRAIAMLTVLFYAVSSAAWAGPSPKPETDRGFIQVAPSQRYFQFEDGTPFFPIGQNDWPPVFDLRVRTKKDIDDYFRNMKAHDVNVLRIQMEVGSKKSKPLYVEDPPGTFNPEFKAWMDTMVGLAEKNDVYLIVVLYPNLIGTIFGNWRFYPYRKKNGGVVRKPHDMVTDPKAREAEKRRMRYFVDNWGKSRHIFSWELFNEFWLAPKGTRKKKAKAVLEAHNRWIDEMGAYIKAYETQKLGRYHLRSVSTLRSEFPRESMGLKPSDANIYTSPNLDFASFHAYGRTLLESTGSKGDFGILKGNKIEPERLIRAIHDTMDMMLKRAPARPVLCTEDFQIANPAAEGHGNPMNPLRKMLRGYSDAARFDLFHVANLSYMMGGAAGSTMRYPSGFYEPEMYDKLEVLSRLAAKVPWERFRARPADHRVLTDRKDLIHMAMADESWMIGWLYHAVPFEKRTPIQATVTLKGVDPSGSELVWIDTNTAKELRTDRVKAADFRSQTPPFTGHIAWIVRPVR